METIKYSDIQILSRQLERGDMKKIMDETGFSRDTVRLAFKAQSINDTYRKVYAVAKELIQKRRTEDLETVSIAKQATA